MSNFVVRLNLQSVGNGVLRPPAPMMLLLVPAGLPFNPVICGSRAFSCAAVVNVQTFGQLFGPAAVLILNGPTVVAEPLGLLAVGAVVRFFGLDVGVIVGSLVVCAVGLVGPADRDVRAAAVEDGVDSAAVAAELEVGTAALADVEDGAADDSSVDEGAGDDVAALDAADGVPLVPPLQPASSAAVSTAAHRPPCLPCRSLTCMIRPPQFVRFVRYAVMSRQQCRRQISAFPLAGA